MRAPASNCRASTGGASGSSPPLNCASNRYWYPYVAVFGVHGSAVQEAACSPNVRLTVESLDFDPSEELGALEGFVRSISCKGLNLGEADCDALHMYWNQKTNAPSWWRL